MIALDTNVLVRILARDHEDQAVRAAALMADNRVFVSLSVLLETEWVLRSSYGSRREAIADAFVTMLGIDNLQLGDRSIFIAALRLYRAGMDFADALHLSSTPAGASFATFDRALRRKAGRLTDLPEVVEPA